MRPIAPSHSGKLACARNPIANATPMTAAMATRLRSTVSTTCALRTALREISITLNRLMIPFVTSEFTATAVPLNP